MSLDTEMAEQIVKLNEEFEVLQKEKELDNIFWKQECDSLQETLKEEELELVKLKSPIMNVYKIPICNEENKILKKVLELAVNYLQREIDGDYIKATEVQAIYEIGKNYFIQQAKEILNSEPVIKGE